MTKRDKNQKISYSYKRFSVLGALINSIVLVTSSIFIVFETIPLLISPVNPNTERMRYLARDRVVVNVVAAFRLSKLGINHTTIEFETQNEKCFGC